MAVVINDFEVIPKAPPPSSGQSAAASDKNPAKAAKDCAKAARKNIERSRRLATY
jgi:hypothetical protein